jgi:hypothetical protein
MVAPEFRGKLGRWAHANAALSTRRGAARQWSPSQLHFVIANGVKMTAMPAWKLTLSDQDIWSLVAFTHELRGISQRSFPCMRAAQPKPKLTAGAPPPAGSMTEGSGALTHRRHTKNAN